MFHQVENSTLAITTLNTSKQKIILAMQNSSEKVPICRKQYSCNHCIQYFKRKFSLMHHTMFHQVENSILAIIAYNSSKAFTCKLNWFWFIKRYPYMKKMVFCICHLQTKFVLIHQRRSKHVGISILAIIAYNTSNENMFWCITKCPNIKKTVLLQSLHTILKKKICFDASHNVPICRK